VGTGAAVKGVTAINSPLTRALDDKVAEVEDGIMANEEEQAPETQDSDKPTTDVEALLDVEVEITAILGTTNMPISQILKLGRGAVVQLNRSIDEDIEVHANNRLVAKAQVIVVDDRLGVTMTEVIKLT
jgi:flagellar motor switch protein FliN/FliY